MTQSSQRAFSGSSNLLLHVLKTTAPKKKGSGCQDIFCKSKVDGLLQLTSALPPTHIPETAWVVVEGTRLWFLAPVLACIYLNYMKGQKERDKCDWSGREAELTEAAGHRPAPVVSELLTVRELVVWFECLHGCPSSFSPSSSLSHITALCG